MTEQSNGVSWQHWLSWLGILFSLVGFLLYEPIAFGMIGAILGIFSLYGMKKTWPWISIIVGIIEIILGLSGLTVA